MEDLKTFLIEKVLLYESDTLTGDTEKGIAAGQTGKNR